MHSTSPKFNFTQILPKTLPKTLRNTFMLLLPLALASCVRENDSFKPKIIITQPEADSISGSGVQLVKGYALDNQGIDRIEVNGIPLFVSPKSASEGTGGVRIQNFAFKTEVKSGQAAYVIQVTDVDGLKTSKSLPIQVDTTSPTLQINQSERRAGVTRIAGKALDNLKVKRVFLDGNPLDVRPGSSVDFYVESNNPSVVISAQDTVGNRVERVIGPLVDVAPIIDPTTLNTTAPTLEPGTSSNTRPGYRRRRTRGGQTLQTPRGNTRVTAPSGPSPSFNGAPPTP
jgi:hypothetical protein